MHTYITYTTYITHITHITYITYRCIHLDIDLFEEVYVFLQGMIKTERGNEDREKFEGGKKWTVGKRDGWPKNAPHQHLVYPCRQSKNYPAALYPRRYLMHVKLD